MKDDKLDLSFTGFGPVHTAWRQTLTAFVIIASLLSWHAIFLRHSTMLLLMGSITKCGAPATLLLFPAARPRSSEPPSPLDRYAAFAVFVVASFDAEVAASFCTDDPDRCRLGSASNPGLSDPNILIRALWPMPYLDYTCAAIWLFVGQVIYQRGEQIDKIYEQQKRDAVLLRELAASSAAPETLGGAQYTEAEAVPVTVSGY